MRPLPIVEKGGVLVVTVGGAALSDFQGAGVRQGLYETLAKTPTPRVALDLSDVDYISSTGIALLIGTKRRVDAAGGQLVLFGIRSDIHDLFANMKLTALFEIATDEAEALSHFPTPPAT